MSNDIISALKNDLAIAGGLDDDTRALLGNTSVGTKRISIKGGVFRKIVGGKEVGTVEDRHMNVIFVRFAHKPSRQYYTGAYKEGERVSPLCWSSDSEAPDAEVKNKQSDACKTCKWAASGSNSTGTGAACRLSWRTAVVLPNNPDGDIMQLVLPATSVFGKEENGKFPFREYVRRLGSAGIGAGRVITKMAFDTKSPVPRVLFSPVSGVPEEDITVLAEQAKKPSAENAIKLNVYQSDEADAPAAPAEPAAPVVAAPKVREKKAAPAATTGDVADVIKEWSSK